MIVYGDNIYRTTDQVLYYGSNRIAKVYYGDSLIYPEPSGSGHYESIVIPVGKKIITYYNKVDPSQTFTVYEYEPITLSANITFPVSSNGGVSTDIDDELMRGEISRSYGSYRNYESIIDKYTRDLFYMPIYELEQLLSQSTMQDDYETQVNALRSVYSYLNEAELNAAYRTSQNSQALVGSITDLFASINYYYTDGNRSYSSSCNIRLSSLISMDFDIDSIYDAIDETYYEPYSVDRSESLSIGCDSSACIAVINNEEYVFVNWGSGGENCKNFYKLITSTGELYYMPASDSGMMKYSYLFTESPTSEDPYINIDIDKYFNWDYNVSYVRNEPITIRTWIPDYDEHGKPIEN